MRNLLVSIFYTTLAVALASCSGVQPAPVAKRVGTDIGDYSPHHGRTDADNYYRVGYNTQPPALDWLQPDMPKYANGGRNAQPLDEYDRRSGYRVIGWSPAPVAVPQPIVTQVATPDQTITRPVTKVVKRVVRKPVVKQAPSSVVENRDFLVYFDHDIDALDAEALNTVDDVYDELNRQPMATAILSGHADRSGNVDYNIGLADRRAQNVRQALLNIGVPAERIRFESAGEHNNAVQTADGVRERYNRRVEIRIR